MALRQGLRRVVAVAAIVALTVMAPCILAADPVLAQSSLGKADNPGHSIRPIDTRPLAPEVAFKDRNGGYKGFIEFRGQPLIVTFWATWCPVCANEIPRIDQFQASQDTGSLQVLAVSIDRGGAAAVEKFYARQAIRHLKIYTDDEAILASMLGITGVPTSFLINADGQMVGVAEGGVDWTSPEVRAQIRALLK